jgi:protein SCO1/2
MLRLHHLASPVLLSVIAAAGCTPAPSGSDATSYPLAGTVVEVDAANRKITIDHEEIPGFMPAMIMPFVVLEKDAALLEVVSPGDEVTARLVVPDSRYWLENLVVVKKGTVDPGAPTRSPTPVLRPGEVVPDVALVNQDGETIRLADYRGRALALTFIFTRCPMPDFCPLMMKNFAAVQGSIVADAGLHARTRLLTVSFDTEYDTPEVLRAFGAPWQKTAPPFTHWELARGTEDAIRTLGGALGLDYYEEDRSFAHNLRTAVVDPEGNLVRIFRGNEWTSEELVAELRAAAGS